MRALSKATDPPSTTAIAADEHWEKSRSFPTACPLLAQRPTFKDVKVVEAIRGDAPDAIEIPTPPPEKEQPERVGSHPVPEQCTSNCGFESNRHSEKNGADAP
jgi:hypothetical protein